MNISSRRTKVSLKNIALLVAIYLGVLLLGPAIGFTLVKLDGEKKAICCNYLSKTCSNCCSEYCTSRY